MSRGLWLHFRQNAALRHVDKQAWLGNAMISNNWGLQILVDVKGNTTGVDSGRAQAIGAAVWKDLDRAESLLSVYTRAAQESTPIYWPGMHFTLSELNVLLPARDEQLSEQLQEDRLTKWFYCIQLKSADWGYRIESGVDGAPGTLWLTPTADAVETVKERLAEFDAIVAGAADAAESGVERAAE